MLQTIKKYIRITIAVIILILGVTVWVQHNEIESITSELDVSQSNVKAFANENAGLLKENIAFKFTIDQINYFNDSLIVEMNKMRKKMAIKDKDLEQMQYLLSEAKKTDTIFVKDTIFKNPEFKLDTLIGDEWFNIRLGLEYPNLIAATPSLKSEKYIITSSTKETVNPPKKCVVARWFQKKHRVVRVEVIENNPYIENKQQRFIEIIK